MNSTPPWCTYQHVHGHKSFLLLLVVLCFSHLALKCLFPRSVRSALLLCPRENHHKNHLISHIRCSPCSTLFTFEVTRTHDAAWPLCVSWPYLEALDAGRKTDGGRAGASERVRQKKRFKSVSKQEEKRKWAASPLLEKMHFICSKTDAIRAHKALLSPPLCPSVLHVWCLCLGLSCH